MKTVLLFVALLAGCTNTDIPMTAEQRATCDEEGGCVVIRRKALQQSMRSMAAEHLAPIYEQGVIDGAEGCKKAAV